MKLLKDYKNHMDGCLSLGLLIALAMISNIVWLGISQFYFIYRVSHNIGSTLFL